MTSILNIRLVNCSNCGYVIRLSLPFWEGVTGPFVHWNCEGEERMKNLGNINGKIEILKDEKTGDVGLIAASNFVKLSAEEAGDLAVVVNYAAYNPEILGLVFEGRSPVVSLKHFKRPKTEEVKSDATEGQQ